MKRSLGPGGRYVFVAIGLAIIYAALDRAGVIREPLPHVFPPKVEKAPEPAKRPPLGKSDFAYRADRLPERCGASEATELRVAATERVAAVRLTELRGGAEDAPGIARIAGVGTAKDALHQLAAGDAEAAVVSVSELVASWPSPDADLRIAGLLAGTSRDLVVAAPDRIRRIADLEGRKAAAVPGSAAEYLLLGALAQEGLADRVTLVPATTSQQAVALLGKGEVDAAAAPLYLVEPLNQEGKAIVLSTVAPLDPILVVTRGRPGCKDAHELAARLACPPGVALREASLQFDQASGTIFGAPALSFREALKATRFEVGPAELVRAWDAARKIRGGKATPGLGAVVGDDVLEASCPGGVPGGASGAWTPEPAPSPSAGATGKLHVQTRPFATIFLDGVPMGSTPLAPLVVPAGKHKLEAVNSDLGRRRTVTVEVEAGETKTIRLEL